MTANKRHNGAPKALSALLAARARQPATISLESIEAALQSKRQFRCGAAYTRDQIHDILGGSAQFYLPHVNGQVVCGCFRLDLNPHAPYEILLGDSGEVLRYAAILLQEGNSIPVFVKQNTNEWIYRGEFRANQLLHDPKQVHDLARASDRDGVVAVLYMEQTVPCSSQTDLFSSAAVSLAN